MRQGNVVLMECGAERTGSKYHVAESVGWGHGVTRECGAESGDMGMWWRCEGGE